MGNQRRKIDSQRRSVRPELEEAALEENKERKPKAGSKAER